MEEGLASNPQCNVFRALAVGKSENPGDQRLIQGLLKEKVLLLFLPKSGGRNRMASNPQCNVFGAETLGNSENPGDRIRIVILGLWKEKFLLLFLSESEGEGGQTSPP